MGTALVKIPIFFFYRDILDKRVIQDFEHQIVAIASATCGFLTYLLLAALASSYSLGVGWASFLSIVLILGGGAFHYATYDASFSHIYTVFGLASLLLVVRKLEDRVWTPIIVGILTGWMFLIRNTNAIALLAIGAGIFVRSPRKFRILSAMAVGGGCGAAIQLLYNYSALAQLSVSSYSGENFIWSRSMAPEILVSYERGLLNYYPILFLSLAWCICSIRTSLESRIAVFTTASYIMLYGSWHSWTLGGGFGHRGFVDVVPLIAAAMFANFPTRDRLKSRILLSGILVTSCALTIKLMLAYWEGKLPFGGTVPETYFGALLGF